MDVELWPGETVGLAGIDVYVRHAAADDAPTMVYVHGLGGSSLNWVPLMHELDGEFDQWALDLPGFGESPPARQSIGAYVAVLTSFLERFGEPVHVAANSMGGLAMVTVAARRPDLVRTLTLVSPAMPQARVPRAAAAMTALAVPGVGSRLMNRINSVPAEDQVRRLLGLLYGEPDRLDGDGLAIAASERARRMEQAHANSAFVQALRSLVVRHARPRWWSAWADAALISCPLLVILGGRDVLVGMPTSRRWRRVAPAAQIVTFPTTGHVAMLERPAEVAELIREHAVDQQVEQQ